MPAVFHEKRLYVPCLKQLIVISVSFPWKILITYIQEDGNMIL